MAIDAINNNDTKWSFNSDIYDIENTLLSVRNRYIEDESDDTLNLGIFGFLTDTEAKKIQAAIVLTGELGNEMFPTRAKLTKNVLAHAIDCDITDINAVPASLTIDLGIKLEDLDTYLGKDQPGTFYFDAKSPIFIENIEFHFDYDIILQRAVLSEGDDTHPTVYTYSAHYEMSETNRISNIKEPYLVQPFQMTIGSDSYILFQAEVRQYTIEETQDKIISESNIENKTYTFEFDNQLADFDVYCTSNNSTVRLHPYYYGSAVEEDELYCWYEYISNNTIRITFDSLSYIPAMNTNINIVAYTTLGKEGNFSYNLNPAIGGLYIDMSSEKYSYDSITCFLIPVGESTNGLNRKTKEELQKMIPIKRFQRDNITTDTDMENYFKLGDTSTQRLVPSKKQDNQTGRVWFLYFLMKDGNNNVIPTNTINVQVDINAEDHDHVKYFKNVDGRYILPAGTVFYLPNDSDYAHIIDPDDVPELYSDEYYNNGYYYMTIYNILINTDPLYTAYYMTISDKNQYLIFNWVNENAIVQFVSTFSNFNRSLLYNQSEYKLTFSAAQSLANDYNMCEVTYDPVTKEQIIVKNNMAVVLVMYKEDEPYRWKEATLALYDEDNFLANWSITLKTDNSFDTSNNILIENLNIYGSATDVNYGFMEPNTKARLYFLAKFEDPDTGEVTEYGRYDLDDITGGKFTGYTVTNIYDIKDGLTFYTNFTDIISTTINTIGSSSTQFTIDSIPMAGMHYMNSNEAVVDFTNNLNLKKAYIEEFIKLVDGTTDIDFKFFNTYGKSKTYTLSDGTAIGNIDITLRFKVSIKSTNDIYTKDDILKYIKDYIENLEDIGSLHFPNLITQITNNFSDRINYIEYITFNDFPVNTGVQHILLKDELSILEVPEFINIRNHYDTAGNLIPWINLEVVF